LHANFLTLPDSRKVEKNLLDAFDLEKYDYEVAFEFRDSGFFRRLFTRKKDFLVYYIRRVPKIASDPAKESQGEKVLSHRYSSRDGEKIYAFGSENGVWDCMYWNTSDEPQQLLMRVCLKLRLSSDNVTFSTATH
jgi:hypothetical protein